MIERLIRPLLAALLTVAAAANPAVAENSYPQRPIHIIVGYTPGGTTDIIARLVAPKLSEALGQPVIVENRPGAGGNLGAELTARAAPDGYTLQMGTAGNMTINPAIYSNIKFDSVRDFAPITLVAEVPNIMVVNPQVPARTVSEFVEWAKARPGKVFFASSGIGNSPHMTGELFNLATGLSMTHVPYRGSGPALTELIAGQSAQVMFDNMPSAIAHVRSGSLRALAVTSADRSPAAPDLPTMKEAGLTDFVVTGWFGLFAPARTPPEIVEKLQRTVVGLLQQPDLKKSLDELGAQSVGNTPAEFSTLVRKELKRWADVVKAADIPPQ